MWPLTVLHVYDEDAPQSAAMNMAIDEALLETAEAPALRFYRWERPAISIGYFSRYEEVASQAATHDVVRRWTGGGIVPHGADLTYSFLWPAVADEKLPPARAIYAEVHHALRAALPAGATLATGDAPKISDACFANPVFADVLLHGAKVAGAAQRRTRRGLLHQGSIQMPDLPADFRTSFASAICPAFEPKELSADLRARAAVIAAQKYAKPEWLRRR